MAICIVEQFLESHIIVQFNHFIESSDWNGIYYSVMYAAGTCSALVHIVSFTMSVRGGRKGGAKGVVAPLLFWPYLLSSYFSSIHSSSHNKQFIILNLKVFPDIF